MLRTLSDLSPKAVNFVTYCLEHYDLSELVQAMRDGRYLRQCEEFDLSEEQWQDAVYVAMKEMIKQE